MQTPRAKQNRKSPAEQGSKNKPTTLATKKNASKPKKQNQNETNTGAKEQDKSIAIDDDTTPRPRRAAAAAASAKLAKAFTSSQAAEDSAPILDGKETEYHPSAPVNESSQEVQSSVKDVDSLYDALDEETTPKARHAQPDAAAQPASTKSKISRMKGKGGHTAPVKTTKRKAGDTPVEQLRPNKKVHIDISDAESESLPASGKKATATSKQPKGQKTKTVGSKGPVRTGKLHVHEDSPDHIEPVIKKSLPHQKDSSKTDVVSKNKTLSKRAKKENTTGQVDTPKVYILILIMIDCLFRLS